MNQKTSPRLWATFGIGIVAVVGVGLLLVLLSRGPGAPTPMVTPARPTPDENPVVASVNDHLIRHSTWLRAVLLDQVLSGLAGQPAPTSDETLQRLINEELVLESFPPEQTPAAAQIEMQIAKLEAAWGVNDATVITALENAGLIRADLEHAIERLLAVQTGLETLQSQGYDTENWLAEQRASAEIVINPEFEGTAAPYTPVAQSQSQPQSPLASPISTPTPAPADAAVSVTESSPLPSPTADLAMPEIAPDFTLRQAGGGTLTPLRLQEQLAQGPVVLVFFQRCG